MDKEESIEKLGARALCAEYNERKGIADRNVENFRALGQQDDQNPLIKDTVQRRMDSIIADRKAACEIEERQVLLIEAGLKRNKQLQAPRNKKSKAVLAFCQELMLKKVSPSAAHLWSRFPNRTKPAIINGVTIFKEITPEGEKKIFCIKPNGKQSAPVGERAFANYYKQVKNTER